jgi:DNA-directed RNA polymerase delta subunit
MDLKDIHLENIKEEVPHKLYLKLRRFHVTNLEALMGIDAEEFGRQNGVGAKSLELLDQFKSYVQNNQKRLKQLQDERTQIKMLPIALEFIDESHGLNIIRETIIDYVGRQPLSIYKDILYDLYGFNGKAYSSIGAIAKKHNYTGERVRQLKNIFLQRIDTFLKGTPDMELRLVASDVATQAYTNLLSQVGAKRIISFDHVRELTHGQFSGKEFIREAVLELLLDAYGFKKSSKTYTYYTKSDFIASRDINLKRYIGVAHGVLKMLKHSGRSFREGEVIHNYQTEFEKEDPFLIKKALRELAEIECIKIDGDKYYQAKFEELSKVNDMAYRVLKEHGAPMHLDEVVDAIRDRLRAAGISRQLDRFTLIMTQHPLLAPIGRTGKWALEEWNINKAPIKDLIIQALQTLDKPSTTREIIDLVQQKRADLKSDTISSIIGMFCIRVQKNKWILPEWREKYADLPLAKRRVRKRKQGESRQKMEQRQAIINYLKEQPNQEEYASAIVNKLVPESEKIKKPPFYRHFNDEQYFSKIKKNGKLLIKLKKSTRSKTTGGK